jgi:carbon storage regulator
MLILARRPGERVVIGGNVVVTVMEITGQTVRLGIAAPEDLPVYREEIWLAVQSENLAAAQSSPDSLPAQLSTGTQRGIKEAGPAPGETPK